MRCAFRNPARGRWATHCLPVFLLALAVLSGCASRPGPAPSTRPIVVEDTPPNAGEVLIDPVIVNPLERDGTITAQQIENESPWELAIRADQAPDAVAVELRLGAIDGFLELQEFTSAETQANHLLDKFLDPVQARRFDLQRGRIALGFGRYQTAIQFLQPLRNDPQWDDAERGLVLKTLADAQLGLERRVDALISLFLRDRVVSDEAQLENQQRILDLLGSLGDLEQALLRQSAGNNGLPGNLVGGWLAFAPMRNLADGERERALIIWRNSFAGHPARDELLGGASMLALDRFNHVALLLPFTSPFGSAAQAFHDGFMDAYNQDTSLSRPALSLHDIGETPSLAGFYYQSAMIEGADFVVGPLGRDAALALLQNGAPAMPTLVLADIPAELVADGLYGISLSPELEAEQVAGRAFADGHRQAAIFRSDSAWGQRAAAAFADAWLALGGTLVTNKSFPDTIEDYSRIIQNFLEVNQSVARRKVLSAQLGLNLEFTPRRRDDMDMLFFAGNARQARLLVPQLRFFQAHDLPIYATANVFTGNPNPAVDADLDGLVFGDMRWMVDLRYETPPETAAQPAGDGVAVAGATADPADESLQTTDAPVSRPVAKSPYGFSPLDRLYALGLETYHLIPRLSALRSEDWQRYNGQAFEASVRRDGNVVRHLEWATFEKGDIVLLDPAPAAEAAAPPPATTPQ